MQQQVVKIDLQLADELVFAVFLVVVWLELTDLDLQWSEEVSVAEHLHRESHRLPNWIEVVGQVLSSVHLHITPVLSRSEDGNEGIAFTPKLHIFDIPCS